MTNEHLEPSLLPTPDETNVFNPWQGHQRRSLLDVGQLRFALRADEHYSAGVARSLVVTCLDQLDGNWWVTDKEEKLVLTGIKDLTKKLGLSWVSCLGGYGPCGEKMLSLIHI